VVTEEIIKSGKKLSIPAELTLQLIFSSLLNPPTAKTLHFPRHGPGLGAL
jgi:hypothetical protein